MSIVLSDHNSEGIEIIARHCFLSMSGVHSNIHPSSSLEHEKFLQDIIELISLKVCKLISRLAFQE
uniref:Uncharacterized protein n=1 Tax=Octopus bimaculoides TaxID=37653 RepID=A0A0L8FQW2_OCTBM